MKFKLIYILLVTALLISSQISMADNKADYFYANVFLSDKEDVYTLAELKINVTSLKGLTAEVFINNNALKTLVNLGFNVEVVKSEPEKAGYHIFDSVLAELESIALSYPEIVHLFELTRSPANRKIMVIKLSNNASVSEPEPTLLFDFNIHGDEKISAEVALCFINNLIDGYDVDTETKELLDNNEIFIIPVLNPDGFVSNRRTNSNFVDLNRNHGWWWDGGGPGPASEPETAAVMQFAFDENFMFAISYHSGAELVNYPFDSTPNRAPDDLLFQYISQYYGDFSGYYITNGFDWYKASGIAEESYYGSNGTLAVLVEISNIKTPNANQIPAYCNMNIPAMREWIGLSSRGIHGAVTDSLTGNPVAARITFDDGGWLVWSDPLMGDFHKFVLAGNYSLVVQANGYEPAILDNILVTDDQGAFIEIKLERSDADNLTFSGYKILVVQTPHPWSSYKNDSLPISALGKADGRAFSLGSGGMVIIDMGPHTPITSVEGTDFTIYEDLADGPQSYLVKGAAMDWNPSDSWSNYFYIGSGAGTTAFELPDGVESIRYLAILDTSGQTSPEETAGADIDAVEHNVQCSTPIVDFSADKTTGKAPLTVNFTSIVDVSPNCLRGYNWNFGDGETGDNPAGRHKYQSPGVYTVTLTAFGPGGADTKTKKNYITVTEISDDDDDDADLDKDDDDDSGNCCG